MVLFFVSRKVNATPIDNFTSMSCEELDAYIENIYVQELLETKNTKDSAEEIYKNAYSKNCNSLVEALNLNGFLSYNSNDPIKANYYLSKADSIIQVKGLEFTKASVRNNMYLGLTAQIGGSYETAQVYFNKALSISEKISFKNGMLQAYLNRSLYYIEKEELNTARELLNKAREYNDGNKLMSGYIYHNLSRTYLMEEDYEQSIYHTNIAEELWTELDFSKGLYFTNSGMAHIALIQGDTLKWKSYLDKALFYLEKDGSYSRHGLYHTLAWYHNQKKEHDQAIKYFEKALEQSASFKENELVNIVGQLISLYEQKGDVESIKRINEKTVDFFDKKSEIYKIEADKWQLKELTLEKKIRENDFLKFRSKVFLISWISTIGFFIFFGFLLFKFYRQRADKIRMQDAQEFRSMVASDLHDNVGSTLAGLAMRSEVLSVDADEKLKNELLGISEISREAMHSLRDTVWAVDVRKDTYKNLSDKMLDYGMDQLKYKKINFASDVKISTPDAYINPELRQNIYLIYKEAITNILKHSSADTVHLKIKQNEKKFKMSIKDNGDTTKVKGFSGSGINNMKMRAEKINGELSFKKEDGYRISFKVKTKS